MIVHDDFIGNVIFSYDITYLMRWVLILNNILKSVCLCMGTGSSFIEYSRSFLL